MTPRRLLWWLHLGLGAGAGLILAAIGVSGSVLALKEPFLRWELGALVHAAPATPDPVAWVRTSLAQERDGRRLMAVMAPGAAPLPAGTALAFLREPSASGASPRHHVVAMDPGSGRMIGNVVFEETLFRGVLEFHRSLLGGAGGGVAVLACGGALCLSILSGLWLWWPRGAKARWRDHLAPSWRGFAGRRAGVLHAVGGVYVAVPMLIVGLSGIALLRPGWLVSAMAVTASPTPPPLAIADSQPSPCAAVPDLAAATALALRTQTAMTFTAASTAPDGTYHIGFGRTTLAVDPRCGGVHALAADAVPPHLRIRAWSQQAHGSLFLGVPGRLAVILTGLALPFLLLTGLFRLHQRWRSGRRR